MIRTILTVLSTIAAAYVLFAFWQLTVGDPYEMPLFGLIGFLSLAAAAALPTISYIIIKWGDET